MIRPRVGVVAVATSLLVVAALSGCTAVSTDVSASATAETAMTSDPTAVPLDDVSSSTPKVLQRDFNISYKFNGTTTASDAVRVPAPRGLVWASQAAAGDVASGDEIGVLTVDPDFVAQLNSGSAERIRESGLALLNEIDGPRVSPVAGSLAWNDDSATIATSGIDVAVDLTPLQVLRLSQGTMSGTATVETLVGKRAVPCEALWLELAEPGISDDSGAVGTLHCRLPRTVETAPGLQAGLAIATPVIENAVLVPNSMLGTDDGGYVVTVKTESGNTTIPITVGISDGVVRVVTSEVPVGAELVPPQAP